MHEGVVYIVVVLSTGMFLRTAYGSNTVEPLISWVALSQDNFGDAVATVQGETVAIIDRVVGFQGWPLSKKGSTVTECISDGTPASIIRHHWPSH